ncbi:MAG: hypothetical protein ABR535_01440, partial [Pyrinomonadaceae bacterium]
AMTAIIFVTAVVIAIRADRHDYIWCAWERLADDWTAVQPYSPDKKTLYVFEDLVAYHFWFATRALPYYKVNVINGLEGVKEDAAFFLPRGFGEVERSELNSISANTFWIAFRDTNVPNANSPILSVSIEHPLLSQFDRAGFESEDVRRLPIGNETAYLVKMRRRR